MNDTPTPLVRTVMVISILMIVLALTSINKTLGRIADRLPVAEEVRTSE